MTITSAPPVTAAVEGGDRQKTGSHNGAVDDQFGSAAELWTALDEPWREAFRQAWAALQSGTIAVGACASTADGSIVRSARNRVFDSDGPHGEIFGSSLAHAEMNVLAKLGFLSHSNLVLTTTLEPCLQCAAAVRLGPIATVRFAGRDVYWDGCHDFAKLSPREAGRTQPVRIGPDRGELGVFGTLIARFGPRRSPRFEGRLRAVGEGPLINLVDELESTGEKDRLVDMDVDEAIGYLWPRLRELAAT
jgi:tRNA(Arg) A34 adenosine deaminase TadA